jgi:hypothetical protein
MQATRALRRSTQTPEERVAQARKAGLTRNTPEYLAFKLAQTWPTMNADQKALAKSLLSPLVGKAERGESL